MGPLAVVGQQHNIEMSDIWLFESCSSKFSNIDGKRVNAVSWCHCDVIMKMN